ncbi:unnamed protein product, partial [Coccothraustes coccothraustes]
LGSSTLDGLDNLKQCVYSEVIAREDIAGNFPPFWWKILLCARSMGGTRHSTLPSAWAA